jgi:hypothetical protein
MEWQQILIISMVTISWGGPIGLGIFLMGLGVLYWGTAQKQKAEQK